MREVEHPTRRWSSLTQTRLWLASYKPDSLQAKCPQCGKIFEDTTDNRVLVRLENHILRE